MESLHSLVSRYETARSAEVVREHEAQRLVHLQRLRRIDEAERGRASDLLQMKRCVERIDRHADVIQSALRHADGDRAVVPMCAQVVREVLRLNANIQNSIDNSRRIKTMLAKDHQPLMENLLRKMDEQLQSWTRLLDVASRNLLNSQALLDNVHNLIKTQRELCTEVISSGMFENLDETTDATPMPDMSVNELTEDQILGVSEVFCSTPNAN